MSSLSEFRTEIEAALPEWATFDALAVGWSLPRLMNYVTLTLKVGRFSLKISGYIEDAENPRDRKKFCKRVVRKLTQRSQ